MQHINVDQAHTLIAALCEGAKDEKQFTTLMQLIFCGMNEKDINFYWNSYHAMMATVSVMKTLGASKEDLKATLDELGEVMLKNKNVSMH